MYPYTDLGSFIYPSGDVRINFRVKESEPIVVFIAETMNTKTLDVLDYDELGIDITDFPNGIMGKFGLALELYRNRVTNDE